MCADEIHTVASTKGEISAWFVYEGEEDINYESVLFTQTHQDLNSFDSSNLYQKPTMEQIQKLLISADLM